MKPANCIERDGFWDVAKLLLMILVVYGHLISFWIGEALNLAAYNSIYFFHMPLFVFISGRFSVIKDKQRYQSRLLSYCETYLVFQFLYTIFYGILCRQWSLDSLLVPEGIMWYLLSLVFWRAGVFFFSDYIKLYPAKVMLISFLLSLAIGFIPVNDVLSLQRTFSFLPFFILGYYSNDIEVKSLLSRIPIFPSFLVFGLVICINYQYVDENVKYIHYGNESFLNDSFPMWSMMLFRLLFLFMGFILSVLFLRIIMSIDEKFKRIRVFAQSGGGILPIYTTCL